MKRNITNKHVGAIALALLSALAFRAQAAQGRFPDSRASRERERSEGVLPN